MCAIRFTRALQWATAVGVVVKTARTISLWQTKQKAKRDSVKSSGCVGFFLLFFLTLSICDPRPLTAQKQSGLGLLKAHTSSWSHTRAPAVNLCLKGRQIIIHMLLLFPPCVACVLALSCLSTTPTPDNEERGPAVKSYLKQSSELRLCANSSPVAQIVVGMSLPATRMNAFNKRAASNAFGAPRRLSEGRLVREARRTSAARCRRAMQVFTSAARRRTASK